MIDQADEPRIKEIFRVFENVLEIQNEISKFPVEKLKKNRDHEDRNLGSE